MITVLLIVLGHRVGDYCQRAKQDGGNYVVGDPI